MMSRVYSPIFCFTLNKFIITKLPFFLVYLQKNNIVENFDSIRPFKDDEVEEVLKKYSDNSVFKKLVNHVYPTWEKDVLPKS